MSDLEHPGVVLTHRGSDTARSLLDDLCEVYADAYGVVQDKAKTTAFSNRATKGMGRPGFALVTAHAGNDLVGFAFGYPLEAGNTYWWNGLQPEPPEGFAVETGTRTFVLAEIEVRREWQGRGIGKSIHDALLSQRSEQRATLATNPDAKDTQDLYESWGWYRVGQVPGASGDYYDAYDLFLLSLSERPPIQP